MNEKLRAILTNDEKRTRLQYQCVFLLLGGVSAFMTLLNIVTDKGSLTMATAVFFVLCLVNFFLVLRGGKTGIAVVSVLFGIEILGLFVFFLLSGNPEGFSAIWIAMLPACGMLLFGRWRATVLCAAMFAILVFFCWIPAGKAMLPAGTYTDTFLMRFPILYVAFFLVSMLLETIRAVTQEELNRIRDQYRYRSAHDYLTDLLNRQGLMEWVSSFQNLGEQAVYMIDIDLFKRVNDSFGHDVGDLVLANVAHTVDSLVDSKVCRWGGEEFVVWFADARNAGDPEEIRKKVEEMTVRIPGTEKLVSVTVSIGVAYGNTDVVSLIRQADEALYRAKQDGRNRVEYQEKRSAGSSPAG